MLRGGALAVIVFIEGEGCAVGALYSACTGAYIRLSSRIRGIRWTSSHSLPVELFHLSVRADRMLNACRMSALRPREGQGSG